MNKTDIENKKKTVVIICCLMLLLVTVLSATYAYFASQNGDSIRGNLDMEVDSTDALTFEAGSAITIDTNENFKSSSKNFVSETSVKAILNRVDGEDIESQDYFVYFNILNNPFIYTVNSEKPELLLQIEDPDGNLVTEIADKTIDYVTVDAPTGSIQGFDITTKQGLVAIDEAHSIEASGDIARNSEQEWHIKVTLVNLNTDQAQNIGKEFRAQALIQPEKKNKSIVDKIASTYKTPGENNLYYHDGSNTDIYGNSVDANDNSYRYAGSNPNNYVCFSDGTACLNNNRYRIIGVIDNHLKLITDAEFKTDYWNSNGSNGWEKSSLLTTLNNSDDSSFLNTIPESWQTKIFDATWYIGGISNTDLKPNDIYAEEVGERKIQPDELKCLDNDGISNVSLCTNDNLEVISKFGLLYLSDVAFASNKDEWINNNYYNNNWLLSDAGMWTLTRDAESTNQAINVNSSGVNKASVNELKSVRPVFYLTSDITYVSGDGTYESPMLLTY